MLILLSFSDPLLRQSQFEPSIPRIYIDMNLSIPFWENTNCFIFGCGLDPKEFSGTFFQLTPQIEKLIPSSRHLTYLGLVIFLESYEVLFFVSFMGLLALFYFNSRVQKPA
jgi:hypothetical protein